MRYRLLALDLDGTVLDAQGALVPDVFDAVADVCGRGLQVVLCTGRRLRTAAPVARELGLAGAIVVNNGVLVKDLDSGATLRHDYLPGAVYPDVVALLREAGSPLVYVDNHPDEIDILVEDARDPHPFQQEYLDDNTDYTRVVRDLAAFGGGGVIMVSLMGDDALLGGLRERAGASLGGRVRTQSIVNRNYRGDILEFVSPASSKWTALRWVAAEAGISPEAIAAVGDDANDVEMIAHAGLGIAMGNAVDAVLDAADGVVGANDEGGVIEAIERVLRES